MASRNLQICIPLQRPGVNRESFLVPKSRICLANPFVLRQPPPRWLRGLSFSSGHRESVTPSVISRKKKKSISKKAGGDEDGVDEDAFEAFFHQLEEDLKNDELNCVDDGDDDISAEDLVKLEQELAEALDDDDGELLGALSEGEENNDEDVEHEDDDDSEEDDEMPIKLKNWQLRRLAYALKNGRRKTHIKNLAADLCLDRAVVLKLLRDPPPNLVLLSATIPDKPARNPVEIAPLEPMARAANPELKEKVPVHVMQNNWSARKRLKKTQVETLEQVFRRTKRPTNTMIGSIVHVTNLPRKKVVKWFEDKRVKEGVPEHRLPYQRSAQESAFTS